MPPIAPAITVSGGELECTDDFTYLGSLLSSNNGAHKAHLNKARSAPIDTFCELVEAKREFNGMKNS